LATLDRVAYPGFESLVTLAAAAAVTERIGLLTNILLAPTRNPVLLAKESASVDRVSGGRVTLGLAVGSREDDYQAVGLEFGTRGRRFDRDLDLIHRVWRGEDVGDGDPPLRVGPAPAAGDRIPILIGGGSDAALARTVRWGAGWTSGGAGPDRAAPFVDRLRQAWSAAGRTGTPRLVGLSYFALGDGARPRARDYLVQYYGERGESLAESTPVGPDAVGEALGRFRAHGYDEVILVPTSARLDQVQRAADAVRDAVGDRGP
jgi:alkanesulfonate monooxygenase SsuD/methylene tetrahydromethanopterin reductase-like flavin-dependent oxidoreductase (luciferase family)